MSNWESSETTLWAAPPTFSAMVLLIVSIIPYAGLICEAKGRAIECLIGQYENRILVRIIPDLLSKLETERLETGNAIIYHLAASSSPARCVVSMPYLHWSYSRRDSCLSVFKGAATRNASSCCRIRRATHEHDRTCGILMSNTFVVSGPKSQTRSGATYFRRS